MDRQRLKEIIQDGLYWESILCPAVKKQYGFQKEEKELNERSTEVKNPESIKS
jgi:hypothetical protein